jgi:hypothetical protein
MVITIGTDENMKEKPGVNNEDRQRIIRTYYINSTLSSVDKDQTSTQANLCGIFESFRQDYLKIVKIEIDCQNDQTQCTVVSALCFSAATGKHQFHIPSWL